jgi:hypothetical protein
MFYEKVSQWNRKEMKKMSHYLLEVVTQSQPGGNPAQNPIFNQAIEWTRAVLEFYISRQYKFCNDATFSYMGDALRRIRTFKEILLPG